MSAYERLENGVKIRADGKGDAWARAHRTLGPRFNMQDLDAIFGIMSFGQNTAERIFAEYVPNNYVNRWSLIRSFALVSMFDRKISEESAFCNENAISEAFYLFICRIISQHQSRPPSFFYVLGDDNPPWRMIGIDIESGQKNGKDEIIKNQDQSEFMRVWDTLGLLELRRELKQWIDPYLQDTIRPTPEVNRPTARRLVP